MRVSAALMIGLLALLAACGRQAPAETHPGNETATATGITAAPVPPHPKIGAVFLGAGDLHTCTAAVLDSAAGDLILTAAHCVAEDIDTTFVAGFKDAADPTDIWKVDATYLDPRWVNNRDPVADFAILRVKRDGGGSLEAEAGGGFALGPAPKPGTVVTVTGYGLGVGGGPIGCQAATGAGARWISVAAVRRPDRRNERGAMDSRADRHRACRWPRRRRVRRKRLVLTAIRRRSQRAADARRGGRACRPGAYGFHRRLLTL